MTGSHALHMQVGSFELKVRRNIAGGKGSSAAATAHSSAPAPAHNQEVAAAPALASVDISVMESIDESLMPVLSPKVCGSDTLISARSAASWSLVTWILSFPYKWDRLSIITPFLLG